MEIIVNFKNYKKGKKALELAKRIKRFVPRATVCVGIKDVESISKLKLKTFTQRFEGREKGLKGTLLNHSDYRISFDKIKKQMKESNKVIICVRNLNEAKKAKKLKPYAVAYEDPKLIGTGKSITKYDSKKVKEFAKMFKRAKTKPFCGAGISSIEEVKEAKRLGCKGVIISSAIAKASNPEKFLKDL